MEIIVKNFNLEKQLNKINASPDHGFIFYDDDEKPEDLSKKYVIRNHKMTKLMIKINSLINKIESETKTSVLNIGQKKRRIERYILVVERINNNPVALSEADGIPWLFFDRELTKCNKKYLKDILKWIDKEGIKTQALLKQVTKAQDRLKKLDDIYLF